MPPCPPCHFKVSLVLSAGRRAWSIFRRMETHARVPPIVQLHETALTRSGFRSPALFLSTGTCSSSSSSSSLYLLLLLPPRVPLVSFSLSPASWRLSAYTTRTIPLAPTRLILFLGTGGFTLLLLHLLFLAFLRRPLSVILRSADRFPQVHQRTSYIPTSGSLVLLALRWVARPYHSHSDPQSFARLLSHHLSPTLLVGFLPCLLPCPRHLHSLPGRPQSFAARYPSHSSSFPSLHWTHPASVVEYAYVVAAGSASVQHPAVRHPFRPSLLGCVIYYLALPRASLIHHACPAFQQRSRVSPPGPPRSPAPKIPECFEYLRGLSRRRHQQHRHGKLGRKGLGRRV